MAKFDVVTPEIVQALPELTQLQLVKDAARAQSVKALQTLEAAGLFDMLSLQQIKDGIVRGPAVPHAQFTSLEMPFIAAVGEMVDEAEDVFNDQYIESGAGFESSCSYKVKLLQKNPGTLEWFDGFVDRFLDGYQSLRVEIETSDREIVEYANFRFRGTAAVLLSTAAALGAADTASRLLDALNDPNELGSVFRQQANAGALFVSSRFLDGEVVNTNLMVHPMHVAMQFHEPDIFDLFVKRGWEPSDPMLCVTDARNNGKTRTHFIPSAGDRLQSVFLMMTHAQSSDGLEVQPEMMDRLLAVAVNPVRKPEEILCMRKWADGLLQSDEPELEMIQLAGKYDLYGLAPEVSIQTAVSRGSDRVLDLVLPHIKWSQHIVRDFQPLDVLFDSALWENSRAQMVSFSDHLTKRLVEYGQGYRLVVSLPSEDGVSPVCVFFAERGCAASVLRCLELGADASVPTESADNLFEHARKAGHHDVAQVILSFQARKAAESALDDCGVQSIKP